LTFCLIIGVASSMEMDLLREGGQGCSEQYNGL
jgi:hypothetical protein